MPSSENLRVGRLGRGARRRWRPKGHSHPGCDCNRSQAGSLCHFPTSTPNGQSAPPKHRKPPKVSLSGCHSGLTHWDLTAFSCGFLNRGPYCLFSSLAQPLPYAYGVPGLQPKVAVARPLPWDQIPRNVSTPTGLRPMRRSPIRPGRNRFAVQS